MKKTLFPLLTMLVFLLPFISGCGAITLPTAQSSLVPTVSSSKLTISTDSRLELLSVILSLFDYQAQDQRLMAGVDFDYKKEVAKTFGSFRDHRAVQILKEITPIRNTPPSFNHDAPPRLMLYLSDPPDLQPQLPISEDIIARAGGQAKIDELLAALRNFAKDTHFMDFYNRHLDFYRQMIAQASGQFNEKDIDVLEAYYGEHKGSYNIKLVPLFGQGSFGGNLTPADGVEEIYFILGTQELTAQNQPLLVNPATFRHQLWHEFGHSFVNPVMDEYFQSLSAYSALYEPISKQMFQLGYGSWPATANEHIVRAVVIRLVDQVEGASAAQTLLDQEKKRGFIYLDPLLKRLRQYEQSRDKYPTFESGYLNIIQGFGEIKVPAG